MSMRNQPPSYDRRRAVAAPELLATHASGQAQTHHSTGAAKPGLIWQTARQHWPEYALEAFGLGLFMISASCFATLLGHPDSPLRQAIPEAVWRRVLMGAAMGGTAILNIYSPWGKRSGAHLNPATTLVFFRLGKVKGVDALFYALAQFFGGAIGLGLAATSIGDYLAHRSVNYVATLPGSHGLTAAFVAEVILTFLLLSVVLRTANHARIGRFTGLFVGLLVALFITIEDPFSGMSMNPARSLASALFAHTWSALWIYFLAPPLGMFLAAELYLRFDGKPNRGCAKLHHQNNQRCIHCGYKITGSNA